MILSSRITKKGTKYELHKISRNSYTVEINQARKNAKTINFVSARSAYQFILLDIKQNHDILEHFYHKGS